MSYRELYPDPHLQHLIYCYWELKTTQPLTDPFYYRVVADGCMDVFFDFNNPSDNFVMGFCKTYTEFPLNNTFHYIGIRFLPTAFPQLFNINAAELSDRFEELHVVAPATSKFLSRNFHADQSFGEIKNALDRYFLKWLLHQNLEFDSRIYDAIHVILSKSGMINLQKDLDTGISQRQLRRLFAFYVGDTAKTFSQVIRFQHILGAKPSDQSLQMNRLFQDDGYYDQAHFIKEFKNFYGVTPRRAFND